MIYFPTFWGKIRSNSNWLYGGKGGMAIWGEGGMAIYGGKGGMAIWGEGGNGYMEDEREEDRT